jgi:hypothetical protein
MTKNILEQYELPIRKNQVFWKDNQSFWFTCDTCRMIVNPFKWSTLYPRSWLIVYLRSLNRCMHVVTLYIVFLSDGKRVKDQPAFTIMTTVIASIVLFHLLSYAKCRFPLPSVFVVLPVVKCLLTLRPDYKILLWSRVFRSRAKKKKMAICLFPSKEFLKDWLSYHCSDISSYISKNVSKWNQFNDICTY